MDMNSPQGILTILVILGALVYIVRILPIDETIKKIAWIILVAIMGVYAIRFLFSFL